MLVNRLGSVLGSLISRFQNGFVPSRAISDNIMISHETLEFIRKKRSGKKSFFALKLDMDKAYDRVSWDFLLNMVRVMGFSQRWVNWIRQCFTTVSSVVVIAIGNRSRSFVPTCGIHQGDPLLPYLFILVAQALSDGLAEFASNKVCRGVAVSPRSPRISHLLFADDCFIFMENGMDHAWCLKLLLDIFCD